jgi:Uma2 family endonuclease
MKKRISTDEYFRMPETNTPEELIYGVVHEPPPPTYGHQRSVGRLLGLLDTHVREGDLGEVCVSPVGVVLDREAGLIVQPDIIFISSGRRSIIADHVYGAPDLVVEVASASTEYRDRTLKLAWYRKYGVRECWLVYRNDRRIEVIDCASDRRESFAGAERIRSNVLREFAVSVNECFD